MRHPTGRRAMGPKILLALSAVACLGLSSAGSFGAAAGASAPASPTWSATAVALPSGAATGSNATMTMRATSCPAPGSCVAVGNYRLPGSPTTYLYRPASELYSSGTWSALGVPLPAGAGPAALAYLSGVTCTGPAACVAVGDYQDAAGKDHALVETLAGTAWTAATAPQPTTSGSGAQQFAYLREISCDGPSYCVAIGTYHLTTGNGAGLIDTLSNGTWTAARAPEPQGSGSGTNQDTVLESLTCPAVGTCAAGGWYKTTSGGEPAFVLTLAGGNWTAFALTQTHGGTATNATGTATSVSCSGPGSCVAVGAYQNVTGVHAPFITTLSGGSWKTMSAPLPSGAGSGNKGGGDLESIACQSAGTCTAVGNYELPTGGHLALVESLSGGTWTPATGPMPAGAPSGTTQQGVLASVSCPVSGTCTAVGSYVDGTGRTLGLIDTLSGGSWTGATSPSPTGAGSGSHLGGSLEAVGCVGGGCVAGGSFTNTSGGSEGLLLAGNMTPSGYYEAASDGGIFAYNVPFLGSEGGKTLVAPVVSSAADTVTGGYYEAAADGGIFAFTAPFYGSMGGKTLNKPIVGMAYDTRTGGYYEVASDGGIFAFTAPFHGSMGGKTLNQPIVGMAFDPATGGYYEVAADGGIFAFTAPFMGSEGGKTLVKPVVGMAYDSLTGGYYEVASDGGLFAFGAPFAGSMGGKTLVQPMVGMGFTWGTGGYYEVASDGGIFAFTAPFLGSQGGNKLNKPVVTISVA